MKNTNNLSTQNDIFVNATTERLQTKREPMFYKRQVRVPSTNSWIRTQKCLENLKNEKFSNFFLENL